MCLHSPEENSPSRERARVFWQPGWAWAAARPRRAAQRMIRISWSRCPSRRCKRTSVRGFFCALARFSRRRLPPPQTHAKQTTTITPKPQRRAKGRALVLPGAPQARDRRGAGAAARAPRPRHGASASTPCVVLVPRDFDVPVFGRGARRQGVRAAQLCGAVERRALQLRGARV